MASRTGCIKAHFAIGFSNKTNAVMALYTKDLSILYNLWYTVCPSQVCSQLLSGHVQKLSDMSLTKSQGHFIHEHLVLSSYFWHPKFSSKFAGTVSGSLYDVQNCLLRNCCYCSGSCSHNKDTGSFFFNQLRPLYLTWDSLGFDPWNLVSVFESQTASNLQPEDALLVQTCLCQKYCKQNWPKDLFSFDLAWRSLCQKSATNNTG